MRVVNYESNGAIDEALSFLEKINYANLNERI